MRKRNLTTYKHSVYSVNFLIFKTTLILWFCYPFNLVVISFRFKNNSLYCVTNNTKVIGCASTFFMTQLFKLYFFLRNKKVKLLRLKNYVCIMHHHFHLILTLWKIKIYFYFRNRKLEFKQWESVMKTFTYFFIDR